MEFISNDVATGQKVLTTIENELKGCESFAISVAFITSSGITPLLQTFKELEEKGIPGKILTSNYLTFSEPSALEKLATLSNIELKVFRTDVQNIGFHTKGYIFKNNKDFTFLVGSSNLTLNAITRNKEWNTKRDASATDKFSQDINAEFDYLWNSSVPIDDYIDLYKDVYASRRKDKKESDDYVNNVDGFELSPNKMQLGFLSNLENIWDSGKDRALLISATGTGKTYASAFAVKDFKPKRMLFLVHREQIAKQAQKSFRRVFGKGVSMGLISGNSKDYDSEFVFSTMQSMSKDDILNRFKEDDFDFIVVDEAHRIGANSYLKILDYFKPMFWLGMTASPERTDDFDVFDKFNHNIAYEIRLQQALESDMLCPFHYFGISDIKVNGVDLDDKADFNALTSDARVNHIMKKMKYFGYSGDKVRGLIFCSSVVEAKELSIKFNERGLKTLAISGSDPQNVREEAIAKLTSDSYKEAIDYVITVDIFNEGVDIPEINQVVMLRPTQSPIVFVQQLGRGLRKADDKEFVTILDFIGNYENNFMIPIALSGDRSYNKDTVRRFVAEGNRVIKGASTIHFDEISRKRIYNSIDSANFSQLSYIKESYKSLKYRLGRIPKMIDFSNYGELDLQRIHDSGQKSYYNFLKNYEKEEYQVKLSSVAKKYIEFISIKLANSKRVNEIVLLEILSENGNDVISKWEERMLNRGYNLKIDDVVKQNLINVMTNEFPTGSQKKTYSNVVFIVKNDNGDYDISPVFKGLLEDNDFKYVLEELLVYMVDRFEKRYSDTYSDTSFVLYEKYTYEDVCRLLSWEKGEVALNIGGYKYDKKTKTYPVFINYDKHAEISDTTNYEDRFLSNQELIAISKSGRSVDSEDVKIASNSCELGVRMDLFVRKHKDDKTSKEFYYLGRIRPTGELHQFTMKNTDKSAVEIGYKLQDPIREDIYEYITKD